ncbi:hypothetical protein [Massilia sp. PWRC2]|uniref:hypothetical protein n=1 Tax=Massilia sp. PWRC2 TaxID=2804626 RepID=UPI003CEF80E4
MAWELLFQLPSYKGFSAVWQIIAMRCQAVVNLLHGVGVIECNADKTIEQNC